MLSKNKVVFIGDHNVGKTCLFEVIQSLDFDPETLATINPELHLVTRNIKGKDIKIELWDTAGEERFRAITKKFIRGAKIVVLVFDLTEPMTFDDNLSWISEVRETENPLIILVGNKLDLEDQKKITTDIGKEFAEMQGIPYVEVSAKSAENVSILSDMLFNFFAQFQENETAKMTTIQLDDSPKSHWYNKLLCC